MCANIPIHRTFALSSFKYVNEMTYMTGFAVGGGIVIMTDSLLFQIQVSEHNSLLCGGELHDNLFLILSQLSSALSYRLGN